MEAIAMAGKWFSMARARKRLVAYLDKHPWIINSFQAIATILAVAVALFLPPYLQNQKELRDLVAYQNLAYFSARLVEGTMVDAQKGVWNKKDNLDYSVVITGLEAIRLNEINPPNLIEQFVEVLHMTKRASQIVIAQSGEAVAIEETINRTRNAMTIIDDHLRKKGVKFDAGKALSP